MKKAGANAGLIVLLGAINALGPISFDMYLPAVANAGETLRAPAELIQQSISVVLIGNAIGMIAAGQLADRFGRRPVALGGLALFLAASIGCGIAADALALVGFRFAQAIAVVAGRIASQALVADLHEGDDLAKAHASITVLSGVAILLSPLAGGVLVSTFGWRAVFAAMSAIGVVVLAIAGFAFPQSRARAPQSQPLLTSYATAMRAPGILRLAAVSASASTAFAIYLINAPLLLTREFGVTPAHLAALISAQGAVLLGGRQLNRMLLSIISAERLMRWATWLSFCLCLVSLAFAMSRASLWGLLIPTYGLVACFPMVTVNTLALAQDRARSQAAVVASMIGVASALAQAAGASLAGAFGGAGTLPVTIGMLTASGLAALVASLRTKQSSA